MMFKINFLRFVKIKFAEIRRLPKWLGFVMSVVKPMQIYFMRFLKKRHNNIRRRLCDGSVIALTKLIKSEFDIDITINDGTENNEVFVGTKSEMDIYTLFIGRKNDSKKCLLGTMNEMLTVDYTVNVPSSVDDETIERMYAVIDLYNSAGFNFKIIRDE